MLTTKSIIASLLVLGSLTSVAAAAPCEETPVRQATVTYQPVYQQPVYAQPIYQPVAYQPPAQPAPSWPRPIGHGPVRQEREITLQSDAHINANGYKIIETTGLGAFRNLTVQAEGGRTKLDKVIVVFADGAQQTVKNLGVFEGNRSLTIDLDGNQPRAIRKIVFYGSDSELRTSHNISEPSFVVRALT